MAANFGKFALKYIGFYGKNAKIVTQSCKSTFRCGTREESRGEVDIRPNWRNYSKIGNWELVIEVQI